MRKEKRQRVKKLLELMVYGDVELTERGHYLIAKITHKGLTNEIEIPKEFIKHNTDEYMIARDIQHSYRIMLMNSFIKKPPYIEE